MWVYHYQLPVGYLRSPPFSPHLASSVSVLGFQSLFLYWLTLNVAEVQQLNLEIQGLIRIHRQKKETFQHKKCLI